MAASGGRDRRPALWPYLVMPLIVVLVFYALYHMHRSAPATPAASQLSSPR